MKPLLLVLCLFAVGCSTSSLEQGGWLQPQPKRTPSMEVTMGGFLAEGGTKSLNMMVGVRLHAIPAGAKFLRVTFPHPQTKAPGETKSLPLTGKKSYHLESSPMSGLKYYDAYPARIQITSDRAGNGILEETTQFIRFELPPHIQGQFGIQN